MVSLLGGVLKTPRCGPDGRMSCEGDFAFCGEDVDLALFVFTFVDEERFGEIEFSGDALLLLLGWI